MKIIIDIPENDLDNFLNKCIVTRSFINSVADFITLDSVIDDVKAEILQLDYDIDFVDYDYNDMPMTDEIHTICREEVLQILDRA